MVINSYRTAYFKKNKAALLFDSDLNTDCIQSDVHRYRQGTSPANDPELEIYTGSSMDVGSWLRTFVWLFKTRNTSSTEISHTTFC